MVDRGPDLVGAHQDNCGVIRGGAEDAELEVKRIVDVGEQRHDGQDAGRQVAKHVRAGELLGDLLEMGSGVVGLGIGREQGVSAVRLPGGAGGEVFPHGGDGGVGHSGRSGMMDGVLVRGGLCGGGGSEQQGSGSEAREGGRSGGGRVHGDLLDRGDCLAPLYSDWCNHANGLISAAFSNLI